MSMTDHQLHLPSWLPIQILRLQFHQQLAPPVETALHFSLLLMLQILVKDGKQRLHPITICNPETLVSLVPEHIHFLILKTLPQEVPEETLHVSRAAVIQKITRMVCLAPQKHSQPVTDNVLMLIQPSRTTLVF